MTKHNDTIPLREDDIELSDDVLAGVSGGAGGQASDGEGGDATGIVSSTTKGKVGKLLTPAKAKIEGSKVAKTTSGYVNPGGEIDPLDPLY